jgi:glycosyltransferase involved in cell wall biosynthesis
MLIERLPPPELNPISEVRELNKMAKLPKADLYFCEGLQGTFYLARSFGVIPKSSKTINILAEPLAFLDFPQNAKWRLLRHKFAKRLLSKYLNQNTLNIIIGSMYTKLLKNDFKIKNYIEMPAGINNLLFDKLVKIRPDLSSNKIVILASLTSPERVKWKGIDIARKAMDEIVKVAPKVKLEVIGEYLPEVKQEYETDYFRFLGFKKDLKKELENYSLALSLGFGDAFPTASLETMLAGIPTITSNMIGTSKVAGKVDKEFVANYFDMQDITGKIERYLNLSLKEKEALSKKSGGVAKEFKSSKIINSYINKNTIKRYFN